MSIISQRIFEKRTALGLSQEKLAKATGVDASYICKLEKDIKNPTAPVIKSLSMALKCTPNDLMF